MPSYSIDVRSATVLASVGAALLRTGSDSPVRLDSSASSDVASRMRQSAGTGSPACSTSTSPGTKVSGATCCSRPSRRTCTGVVEPRSSARTARSVCKRWMPPRMPLAVITPPTSAASVAEPTIEDSAAPSASTGVSGLASSSSRARPKLGWCGSVCTPPGGWLGRRRAASSASIPSAEEPMRASTSSTAMACQGVRSRGVLRGSHDSRSPSQAPVATAARPDTLAALSARRAARRSCSASAAPPPADGAGWRRTRAPDGSRPAAVPPPRSASRRGRRRPPQALRVPAPGHG